GPPGASDRERADAPAGRTAVLGRRPERRHPCDLGGGASL
ncbi:MAG: hypothetical protein AVDCRST_MAG66-558, partial [uncultured Pseudonocardia sp.]